MQPKVSELKDRILRARDIGEVITLANDRQSCSVEIVRRNGSVFTLANVLMYAKAWGAQQGVIEYNVPQVRTSDWPGEMVVVEYAEGGSSSAAYIIASLPGLNNEGYARGRSVRESAAAVAGLPLSKVVLAHNSAILFAAFSEDAVASILMTNP